MVVTVFNNARVRMEENVTRAMATASACPVSQGIDANRHVHRAHSDTCARRNVNVETRTLAILAQVNQS